MIIKAKYMGVCPRCNKNILVGDSVVWNHSEKPFHVECQKFTAIQVMEIFFKTHKGRLRSLPSEMVDGWEIYNFIWEKKDGTEKHIQYYQNGDRYFPNKPKPLLGVR